MAASSNNVRFSYVREATRAQLPPTPAFQVIPTAGGSLAGSPRSITSNVLRGDRRTYNVYNVGLGISGNLNFEFASRVLDPLLEAAAFGVWVKTPESKGTTQITSVNAAGVFTVAAGQGTAFLAGMLVKSSGWVASADNAVGRVTASTSTSVTTTIATASETSNANSRLKAVGIEALNVGDIQVTSGSKTITVTGIDPVACGLVAGKWFELAGSSTGKEANNGDYRVQSITGSGPWTITVDRYPSGITNDTAAAARLRLIFADHLRDGATIYWHSIEKAYLAGVSAPIAAYYHGCAISGLRLAMSPNAIITGSLEFVGLGITPHSTTFATGATYAAAQLTDAFNTASNLARIAENGQPISRGNNLITSLSIEFANNLREIAGLGILGNADVGVGAFQVRGEAQTLLDDPSMLSKVVNNTLTSLDFKVRDFNGVGYYLDIPRIKYGTGTDEVGGPNTDITPRLTWEALGYTAADNAQYMIHLQTVESLTSF